MVSKVILQKIIDKVKTETKLQSWQSTQETLDWFLELPRGKNLSFLSYDIENFYPSITPEVLKKSLDFAKQYINITEDEMNIIMHSRKSFLEWQGKTYVKKDTNGNFEVTQGGFDSCQACEIVGLFLLSQITKIITPTSKTGLYRDDGLICGPANGRSMEITRQKLVKLMKENGFKITWQVNIKRVEFLDVVLDLIARNHLPFRKPNDGIPQYVHRLSNHPPAVSKKLPEMINNRISSLSSNEEIFEAHKDIYQTALKNSSYNYQMKYNPSAGKGNKKGRRRRKVIWFNPPWSSNIKTPVGKYFLDAVNSCFPEGHPLHKLYNRATLKISYRTVRNLQSYINAHNKKILDPPNERKPSCNCKPRDKINCPVPGACNSYNVIYQVDVEVDGEIKTYFGQAMDLKRRIYQHRGAFKNENSPHQTALSKYIWKLKKSNRHFNIK